MGVNVVNVLMSPAEIYVATFGAAEPASGTWTTPTTPWVDAGSTSGGVKFNVSMDFKPLEVDQVPDEVGVRMTGRKLTVETTLAEVTLDNIKYLMNGGTQSTSGGAVGVGTATIVASTGVFTTPASHGLVVGDMVKVATVVTTAGIVANTTYYVRTAPSGTTFTLSATSGGAALTLTTDGSVTGLAKINTSSFEPLSSAASFVPTYSAILLRGQAPGTNSAFYRHFIVRKVLSTDGFEIEMAKDKQQGLKAKFAGYFVSNSVAPFAIIDQVGA